MEFNNHSNLQTQGQPGENNGAKNLSRFFGEFIRRTENTDESVLEPETIELNDGAPDDNSQKPGDAISVSQLEQTLFANRQQLSQPANEVRNDNQASPVTLDTPITDYKPSETSKKHVYTINEMLSLSKEIPKETIETISSMLPKKKFWRLYQKHTEPRGPNSKARGQEGTYDKKLKNIKGQKPGNNKRFNNKFGRIDKGNYIEENDINANNDDLIALEEEIGSSPNSMMDFEAWKAKMKDMERKKKGLAPLSESGPTQSREVPSRSSSSLNFTNNIGNGTNSISEFLNMSNTKSYDEVKDFSDQISTSDNNTEIALSKDESVLEDNILDSKPTDDDQKASSSRFSSFFSTTSKENKPNPGNNNSGGNSPETIDNGLQSKVNKTEDSKVGGSRLMSFFQTPQNESTQGNYDTNVPGNTERPILNNQPSSNSTRSYVSHDPRTSMNGSIGGTPVSLPGKLEHQNSMQPAQIPPQFGRIQSEQLQHAQRQMPPGMMFPPNPQNNSSFFQGLLTKGKANEQGNPTPNTPTSVRQENNGAPIGNQQTMPPMGMPPPGFPMGMPPPNMMPPPGMAGFPMNMPRGQLPPHLEQKNDRKDGNPPQGNNNNGLPFMQGMGPPPPGFPPLPNIPMGFPSGQFPPNMGPPMNQNTYGKVPMQINQQNMPNFPNQQSQNMKQNDKN
ncbi:Protein EAP1 [Nakaseomyces bracarensis]|uniref:Protein EAP1 n=1 Tax=Nakaseomyces bracarensis TaxID=273131 RepID=A0ABR4NSC4_9SACH